ncbi:SubName: Full=Uncharacterized protein {ECO:0000313/EMBL:CCA72086.1} [Serendipita indica DSM 11827]|nr:SubName: Full=Uncharacterized protein {ECO:0000313/EMBL:CCA72086.1} [Serendipita indica DSM 11827]
MPKLEKLQLLVTGHNERESILALQGYLFASSLREFLNGFSNCVVNLPRWDYPSLEAYTLWYPTYAPTLSHFTQLKCLTIVVWVERIEHVLIPMLTELLAKDEALLNLEESRYSLEYGNMRKHNLEVWRKVLDDLVALRRLTSQIRERCAHLLVTPTPAQDELSVLLGQLEI